MNELAPQENWSKYEGYITHFMLFSEYNITRIHFFYE